MNTEQQADKPKLGDWWCFCCVCDLKKISTREDLEEALDSWETWSPARKWSSLDAAIADLKLRGWDEHDDVVAEKLMASETAHKE
jgi:hypothetical protein